MFETQNSNHLLHTIVQFKISTSTSIDLDFLSYGIGLVFLLFLDVDEPAGDTTVDFYIKILMSIPKKILIYS